MSSDQALAGRSFVVTGGGGFIGSRLIRRLAGAGADRVVTFDRSAGAHSVDASPLVRVVGSVLSLQDLAAAIAPGDVVVHLAGMTHAGQSIQVPETCFELNAMGTVRVLEAARQRGAAGFIFVSTGLVYGAPKYQPVDEQHPTLPLTPYAASKLAAEAAVLAYSSNYNLPAAVLRLSNVYGTSGHPDAVHSLILNCIRQGQNVELLDLESTRDFVYVDDVVEGIVRSAVALEPHTRVVANLSSARGTTIEAFARALVAASVRQGGPPLEVLQKGAGHLSAVREFVLDNQCLQEFTKWVPQMSIEAGADRAVAELMGAAQLK